MTHSSGLAADPTAFRSVLSIISVTRLLVIHLESGWPYYKRVLVHGLNLRGIRCNFRHGDLWGLWEKETAANTGVTQALLSEVRRNSP